MCVSRWVWIFSRVWVFVCVCERERERERERLFILAFKLYNSCFLLLTSNFKVTFELFWTPSNLPFLILSLLYGQRRKLTKFKLAVTRGLRYPESSNRQIRNHLNHLGSKLFFTWLINLYTCIFYLYWLLINNLEFVCLNYIKFINSVKFY